MDQDAQQSAAQRLVSKGVLTHNQLTKALEYQCRLPPGQFMPLLKILLEFEYVTEDQLRVTLGDDYLQQQDPIGRILVEQGIVSSQQLEQALQVLNSFSRSHVTDILIDLGLVTRSDIERAISLHQIEVSQQLNQPTSTLRPRTQEVPDADEADEDLPPEPAPTVPESEPSRPSIVEQTAVHLPLGRQLIARGFLNEDELRDAIEYQQRLPKVMHRPIGEILVMLGYITEAQLKETLASQPTQGRSRIGELLIKAGLIEDWQLAHALSLQFSPEHAHKKLGQLLIELGYAQRDEIEGVLARHYREQPPVAPPAPRPVFAPLKPPEPVYKPLGQILVEKGYITPEQLEEALAHHAGSPDAYMPLGDILVLKGYLSEGQLQECLAEQPEFSREPIGQVLIRQGLIQDWQLSHALCMQFDPVSGERRNLGAILVEQGYCSQDQIEAAVLRDLRQKRAAERQEED